MKISKFLELLHQTGSIAVQLPRCALLGWRRLDRLARKLSAIHTILSQSELHELQPLSVSPRPHDFDQPTRSLGIQLLPQHQPLMRDRWQPTPALSDTAQTVCHYTVLIRSKRGQEKRIYVTQHSIRIFAIFVIAVDSHAHEIQDQSRLPHHALPIALSRFLIRCHVSRQLRNTKVLTYQHIYCLSPCAHIRAVYLSTKSRIPPANPKVDHLKLFASIPKPTYQYCRLKYINCNGSLSPISDPFARITQRYRTVDSIGRRR